MPGRRIDAGDPQGPELPFSLPPIPVGVLTRLCYRLLSYPVYVLATADIAFGLRQNLFMSRPGSDSSFYSWHLRITPIYA